MPNFNYIQVQPNSTGLKLDTNELINGSNTVERQNICIADPSTAANVANVVTKGNQGAFAFATQSIKDTGRTSICFSFGVNTITTETFIGINNICKAGNASYNASSYTVTTGKTLRIQCINLWAISSYEGAALNLRSGPATGMTVANSFILISLPMVPQTNWLTVFPAVFPDGFEIPGGTTIGISMIGYGGTAYQTYGNMIGYEY